MIIGEHKVCLKQHWRHRETRGGDRRFDTRVGHIKLRIRVEHETGGVGKHWSQAAKTGMKTGS